ncbi:aldehyde oxidase [Sulfolobus acidocaldarius SUSAZ]|nr:aldehyde oxidase [Sulfolobus acidocaldarius SUSAZ]
MRLKEHHEIISGNSRYIDDLVLNDMVYLGVVRSTYARGIIKGITEPSGVELFLTQDRVKSFIPARPDRRAKNIVRMPVLANGVVNFVGQPIVAFIVKDRYEIEDKIEEVSIDYDPLTPVLSLEDALKNEVKIHPDGNIALDTEIAGGDLEQKLNADVVIERELNQDRLVANPMEPKGLVAYYDGSTLNLIGSFQSSFRVKSDLQEVIGLQPENIVVRSAPNVGGGFGNKVPAHAEYVLASIASIILKKPVKWIETRRDHLTNPTQGRGVKSKVRLYGKRDGTILGFEGEIAVDLGAYAYSINTTTPSFIAGLIGNVYRTRFSKFRALAVYTNKPPTGPYRGAGRPEAVLITETLIEEFAEKIGKDSIEIREMNLIEGNHTTPLGYKIDKAGYKELFLKGKETYNMVKNKYKDKGVALVFFSTVVRNSPGEGAKVRVGKGKVEIFVGTGPHGQAHKTTFSILASETLGISPDMIEVKVNDTLSLKEGVGSFGSRSASAGGLAVIKACKELLSDLRKRNMSLNDAINSDGYIEYEVFAKAEDIYSPGVHIAVVDFDREMCKPKVLEYYAIDDVGRAIIPSEVEGQIVGGILQGLSQIYLEGTPFDENGNPIYSSIAEAGVPTSLDADYKVFLEIIETPTVYDSKARGVGEEGTTGALASVFIALEKLLKKRFNGTPISFSDLC